MYSSYIIVALSLLCSQSNAFRWELKESFEANKFFTFSERFMFATGNGPVILEQGQSYIDVDVSLTTLSTSNTSTRAVYAIYAAEEDLRKKSPDYMCAEPGVVGKNNPWAVDVSSCGIFYAAD